MNRPDFDEATFLAMAPDSYDRLIRLAAAYEKSTRTSLNNLATAIEQENLDQTREIGHKLKSGSKWFGALAIGAIGERLENLNVGNDIGAAKALLTAAETSFAIVQEEVAEVLAHIKTDKGERHVAK